MLTRRFRGGGSEAETTREGAPRGSALEPPAARYECQRCGAHATGQLARATHGRFCSTCGSNDLVPIEEHAGTHSA